MNEFLNTIKDFYQANTHVINVCLGVVIFLIFFIFSKKVSNLILSLIAKIAYKDEKKRESFKEVLMKPMSAFFVTLGLFLALNINFKSKVISSGFKIITILIICIALTNFLSSNVSNFLKGKSDGDDAMYLTALKFISNIFKIMIVALAVVMVASELGYNINGLITGLGVGGLAVSLAAKDALSNLISGFIIVFDKPFKIGEYIQTKDVEGTVLEVSLRTTKIRTVDDSVVTVPNSKLTDDAIINISRKDKRAIDTEVGLTYSTDNELISKCINDIKLYLLENKNIINEPLRVELAKLDSSSINISVFCYTNKTDINDYYSVLNDVNMNIKKIVEDNGADFAFPSSSVYIEKN